MALWRWVGRRLGGAVAAGALLAGVACSGDGGARPEDWSAELCADILTWRAATDRFVAKVQALDFSRGSEEAKRQLVLAVDDVLAAHRGLVAETTKLKPLPGRAGTELAAAVALDLAERERQLSELTRRAGALDPRSTSFEDDMVDIFDILDDTDFRSDVELLASRHEAIGDVLAAINGAPDCAAGLFGSAGAAGRSTVTPSAATPVTTRAPTRVAGDARDGNERWAAGLCNAIDSYVVELTSMALSLDVGSARDAAEAKATFVTFLDDARKRTEELRDEVKALEVPDLRDSAGVHAALVGTMEEMVALFTRAQADATRLDVSSLGAMQGELERIGKSFETAFDELGASFDDLDKRFDLRDLGALVASRPEWRGVLNLGR